MNLYPKRLIEVDLSIKRISAHAPACAGRRREKSIRHGHISTLHLWWARRPLAACRAVLCAALWPNLAHSQVASWQSSDRISTDRFHKTTVKGW
jgi:adenine-specific DNA methylase